MKQATFALVTGASRGLGKAFARELAERHQNLILVGRSVESLSAFALELRKAKPITVVAFPMDLASPGAGQKLAQALSDSHLGINLLVNNAGFGLRGEFRTLDVGRQVEMLRLNNAAIVELTYSLLPDLLEQRYKGIINVSSTAGFQPIPYASLYSATKAFLTTFSLALEQELRAYGVTVVTVCPGRLRPNANASSAQPAKGRWAGVTQTHEEVVRNALRALENGGGLTVPGALNKFSVFAQRLIPRRLVPRLVAKMSRA
jgi:short-subunit dehydrogenase